MFPKMIWQTSWLQQNHLTLFWFTKACYSNESVSFHWEWLILLPFSLCCSSFWWKERGMQEALIWMIFWLNFEKWLFSNSKMLTNKHWECKKYCYERFHLDPSRVLLMFSKWPTEAFYSQKLRCPVGVTIASEMALAQGLLRYESLIKRCQLINNNLHLKNILHNQSFLVSNC